MKNNYITFISKDIIEGPVPEGDQATGEALVLYINIIRMFVCMCVRELNVRNWLTGYASIVYRSTHNLIRWVFKK